MGRLFLLLFTLFLVKLFLVSYGKTLTSASCCCERSFQEGDLVSIAIQTQVEYCAGIREMLPAFEELERILLSDSVRVVSCVDAHLLAHLRDHGIEPDVMIPGGPNLICEDEKRLDLFMRSRRGGCATFVFHEPCGEHLANRNADNVDAQRELISAYAQRAVKAASFHLVQLTVIIVFGIGTATPYMK